jgi:hypothetical protein
MFLPLQPRILDPVFGCIVEFVPPAGTRLRAPPPPAQCRADLGQGPGHTLKNVHTTNHQSPITNHQSPITNHLAELHRLSVAISGIPATHRDDDLGACS